MQHIWQEFQRGPKGNQWLLLSLSTCWLALGYLKKQDNRYNIDFKRNTLYVQAFVNSLKYFFTVSISGVSFVGVPSTRQVATKITFGFKV